MAKRLPKGKVGLSLYITPKCHTRLVGLFKLQNGACYKSGGYSKGRQSLSLIVEELIDCAFDSLGHYTLPPYPSLCPCPICTSQDSLPGGT
mgnify:CR=1 FL=1